MIYRKDRAGRPISQLGFGCMRFARKGNAIDYEAARDLLAYAIENGVNYLDTAYVYPGSEECVGRALEETGLRDRINLATKLPQFRMKNLQQVEKTFQEELARLRTDRIDFYLMHMFTTFAEWENLEKMGIRDWIAGKKAEGSVRNIGFSFHGKTDVFLQILNAYDWDFCQIQYNYLDEHSQAGRSGLEAAAARGIPVIIMEPLRGGRLVNLPEKALRVLAEDPRGLSPAQLALRWLWDQPGVTCVLSGMNSLEMVKENIRTASEAEVGCFDETDRAVMEKVRTIFREKEKVGCTGCRYCMPCPKGVDIPGLFYYYNLMYLEKKWPARMDYASIIGLHKEPAFATQCVGCGKCESVCPQHLPIREKLKEADKAVRPWPLKAGLSIARKFVVK